MKKNYTIIEEVYLPDGYAKVSINTDLGVFSGETEPDEIDSKYLSAFHANDICLMKALRKFAKAAVSALKREISLLEGIIKQAVDCCDVDITTLFRLVHQTLKQKQKELEEWNSRINALSNSIKNRISTRDALVKKYIDKDKTN